MISFDVTSQLHSQQHLKHYAVLRLTVLKMAKLWIKVGVSNEK